MLPLSLFDEDGVDISSGSRNMNYLYGLSDFFSFVFEDTETLNTLMEANALKASEVYSNFLQMTSSITLAGIQTDLGVTIKLLLVRDSFQEGLGPKYKIDLPIKDIKYLVNRPFLPTDVLEKDVDFSVTQIDATSCYVEFARPLEEYLFSKRPTVSGENEFAIWATDLKIDDALMYKHYGKLLGLSPEVSSEQFSNFVYGLFYLYLNGPTLQLIEQGLNLVMGIPLVRNASTILDIRYNSESDQYLVIADTDSYLLPAGIDPVVNIDDEIVLGTALAKWVELKDYVSGGKWWIGVSLPTSLIRALPGNQPDRFAREGSNFDYLMTNFLYRHSFLVRINIGGFNSNKYFSYLSDILYKAKPAYTQPVYVWKSSSVIVDILPDLYEDGFSTSEVPGDPLGMSFINGQAINDMEIN